MSKYTTELRYIIENGNTDIGLSEYPIFDESYRKKLNQKIINHFWMREIGFETFGLFKFKMATKMSEIMPLYNQRYLSTLIEYDPLKTYEITETENRDNTEENTSNSETQNKNNDTPMGSLGNPYADDYATTASNGKGTFSEQNQKNESVNRSVSGKNDSRSYAELIVESRKAMLNVDMEVIRELEPLFMQIW